MTAAVRRVTIRNLATGEARGVGYRYELREGGRVVFGNRNEYPTRAAAMAAAGRMAAARGRSLRGT